MTTKSIGFMLMLASVAHGFALYRRDIINGTATAGETYTGDGTYYGAGAGQAGACALYDPIPPPQNVDVVAMNTPQWAGSSVCGACVSITGAKGSAIARVVDRCPPCASGALDMSEELFPKIDDPAKGRVTISWQFVPCPESFVSGPMTYLFQVGSTIDWFAFQVRNHKLAVSSVEISSPSASAWQGLERTSDNYFRAIGVGAGPYSIRVTSLDGQQVIDTGIELSPGQVVSGQAQFD